MQARRMFIKRQLEAVFEKNKKRPSIILKINKSKEKHLKKDRNGYEREVFLSSRLCTNKNRARLDYLIWHRENAKLYTIHPQQKVDVSNWLTYPYENSFPLYTNNCCQILSESNLHFLVEVDTETYGSEASTTSAKLEDYGLIVAWTISSENMNFILKTDLEHITNFMFGILQECYYINNGLFVTRVQSVLISGKPHIYSDTEHLGSPPNKNIFYALCDAVQQKYMPKEVARIRGVQSQDKNLNIEFTDEFFAEVRKNIGAKSNSAPATRNSSPTKHIKFIKYPYNLSYLPEDVHLAVTGYQSNSEDFTNVHLPNVTEKKDNTNDEEFRNDQSESTRETDSKNSELDEEKNPSKVIKPPNILIYADIREEINSIENLLLQVLEKDRYVIHSFSKGNYDNAKIWIDQISLIVLCGDVDAELGAHLVEYIVRGGKLLALCSDMLHILLPSFKTTEVRENELVHFSYGEWKHVRMMHHIFCYHASPIRARFSQDHEDTRGLVLNPPTSTDIKDKKGNLHSFDVKVLGREETWHSPSILLATLPSSGGKVVFSQIHLEIDPLDYDYDQEEKLEVLKKSDVARVEIISDLLSTHLGLDVNCDTTKRISVQYTPGYFLGKFEMKMKMLEKLKNKMNKNNVLHMSEMKIQFCANNEDVKSPSAIFLPIMMHSCPPNFSTVDYFENLHTKELGRLVIYTDVLTSSMKVTDTRLEHGLIVIPRQQINGRGRHFNKWLSPKGCAMFTLQIHISAKSTIGRYISILQHLVAIALVSSVRSIKGYEDIDLRIKWPNDVYIGNSIKIGGIIISSLMEDEIFVCNIGAGINLSNSKPTTCINDAILQYNQKYSTKLETFSYEKYLALVFNEMEILLDILQSGNIDHFYQLYYKYWLHTNSNVMVTFINGRRENVTILGIDNYGYLLVQGKKGMFSVHSDENSFDVLSGLIVPK